MLNYQDIFGRRLQYAMKKRGVTVKELSQRSGVGLKSIYGYTNGDKGPSLVKLVAIGKALHVSLDWLCGMRVKEDGNA